MMAWESSFGFSPFVRLALSAIQRRSSALLVLPLLGALSCSVLVDANRVQCKTDDDCKARGASFAQSSCVNALCAGSSKWACLENPPASMGGAGPFRVTMHFADLIKKTPVVGVRADLCRKLDVSCADPAVTATSDAMGNVSLSPVDAGFSGYVSLKGDTTIPTLYFLNPLVDRDQDIPSLSLYSPPARQGLLSQLGGDSARADVLLSAWDCQGKPASGIAFALTPPMPGAIAYYLSSGLPTHNSTMTDATGYGGFVSLPSGTVTITATDTESQTRIATITLVVREGSTTWSRVLPDGT